MCKVNFVSEFNLFMRYARNNGLPMRERMLWIALFYIANDRATYNEQTEEYDWPEDFIPIANGELYLYSCLDKRAVEALRNSLKQRGLIDFVSGLKNKRVPTYKINYLSLHVGYKNVPNDVPNNDPRSVPKDVPNNDPKGVPKNAPSPSPYPKGKLRIPENKTQTILEAVPRIHNGAPVDGFVDMGADGVGTAEFVKLPFGEASM